MFIGGSDSGPSVSAPVRPGAALATVVEADWSERVAFVPFVFAARLGRIKFEPRAIVRVRDGGACAESWGELAALRNAWSDRYVRVLSLGSLADPLLEARVTASALVIALDLKTIAVATGLWSSAILPPIVDLSTAVPWQAAVGSCQSSASSSRPTSTAW